ERLRNARNVLQRDLGNVTVTMIPPRSPDRGEGYFEVIEGPITDKSYIVASWPASFTDADKSGSGLPGDTDDMLMFTVRSNGEPFVGLIDDGTGTPLAVQSQVAEIIWYAPDIPTGTLPPVNVEYPNPTLPPPPDNRL